MKFGKRWSAAVLAALLTCTLPGCAHAGTAVLAGEKPQMPAEDYWQAEVGPALCSAMEEFTGRSGALVLLSGENICYSPVSLYYALAMTASGAAGQTEAELLGVLGVEDAAELPGQMKTLYQALYRDEKHCRVYLANSLWMREGVDFYDSFTAGAAKDFYAGCYTLDFEAPRAADAMSTWVNEQTRGLLQPKIQLQPETILVLLNTVYFKANWADAFDAGQTREEPFYRTADDAAACDFMHSSTCGDAVAAEGYTMASIPFEGGVEMFFLLPDENKSLESLLAEHDLKNLLDMSSAQYRNIEWSVPKFSVHSDMDLRPVLETLGVKEAFVPGTADLSRMCDLSTLPGGTAYLSEVKQGTAFSIDEEGAEAAAYTEIAVGSGSAAPPDETITMTLNRPFLYGLRDERTGVVLFLGRMDDPART